MRHTWVKIVCLAAMAGMTPIRAADPSKSIKLVDGDRIVYLGNTFAERDAKYGYLETRLTIENPDKTLIFRNLGWSGDTVWGDARARFGTRADGFQHLKEHVIALKPTVILVAYGMNESFAGEAGLAEFGRGLNTLLDTLAETKAKIVLISPIAHEDGGPPLPPAERHNRDLQRYSEVIAGVAKNRNHPFVDLFSAHMEEILHSKTQKTAGVTDDGIHPVERGYRFFASDEMKGAFESDQSGWLLKLRGSKSIVSHRVDVSEISATQKSVRFKAISHGWKQEGGDVVSDLLKAGRAYTVKVDGKTIDTIKADDYVPEGGRVSWGYDSGEQGKRFERLRKIINEKNELYFYRWRPQNETYLFGFRKHEQGNNGREIPLFDPLVAEKEAEIARLKQPVAHVYELIPAEVGK